MPNDRLRTAIENADLQVEEVATEVGVDPKTAGRWITDDRVPHRKTAYRVAKLLDVPAAWLWPPLEEARKDASRAEVVNFYPHRSDVPKHLWFELLLGARERIDLLANASLFLPEDNPESIKMIRKKAERGVAVRIVLGDPDSEMAVRRGEEEQLYEAIPARIRMALAYYRPLAEVAGVSFHLHRTTLYNSIFRYDGQMLINQHAYGTYGYMAPILHIRQVDGGDLFDMYETSYERVWHESFPVAESNVFGPSS